MPQEILPGVYHWSAMHEGIGHVVYSAFDAHSGTLIDPMEPAEGIAAIAAIAAPQRIVLSNRHHYRHSARFVEQFGCRVLCHEAGSDHFDEHQQVESYRFDEQLAGDVRALQLAAICAEESTLFIEVAGGALSFGDGLTRNRDGALAFMPDSLLGKDPAAVRAGLASNLRRMFDEDFDALLFAHAEPIAAGGRELLSEFLAQQ